MNAFDANDYAEEDRELVELLSGLSHDEEIEVLLQDQEGQPLTEPDGTESKVFLSKEAILKILNFGILHDLTFNEAFVCILMAKAEEEEALSDSSPE